MQENDDNSPSGTSLNIAKMGSKNRACFPPNACDHIKVKQGDRLAILLRTDKNDKKYLAVVGVKPENFNIEDEETISEMLTQ